MIQTLYWFLFLLSSLELLLIKFLVRTIYIHLTYWTLKTTTKQQFKCSTVLKKTITTRYEEYSDIYLSKGLFQDWYETCSYVHRKQVTASKPSTNSCSSGPLTNAKMLFILRTHAYNSMQSQYLVIPGMV